LSVPEFLAAYRDARRRVVERAVGRLQAATGKAVTTLAKELKGARAADRIKAADLILSHALKAAEFTDLA